MRRELAPEGEKEMFQIHFAKALGRSSSSVSKVEKGTIRPSDDFLAGIARTYPRVADLDKMLDLRAKQFGSEEEWSQRRKELGIPQSPGEKRANSALKADGGTTNARTSSPASLRERLTPPAPSDGQAPFGMRPRRVQPTPSTGASGESRLNGGMVSGNTGVVISSAAGSHPAEPGLHSTLVKETLPILRQLSGAEEVPLRLIAAAILVTERLRHLYPKSRFAYGELRAASFQCIVDLFSLLSPDAVFDPEDPMWRDLRGLNDALTIGYPERWEAKKDLTDLVGTLLAPIILPDREPLVDLIMLRALTLGIAR